MSAFNVNQKRNSEHAKRKPGNKLGRHNTPHTTDPKQLRITFHNLPSLSRTPTVSVVGETLEKPTPNRGILPVNMCINREKLSTTVHDTPTTCRDSQQNPTPYIVVKHLKKKSREKEKKTWESPS